LPARLRRRKSARMTDFLTLDIDGPVAILTMNRPETLNALGEPGDGDAFAAKVSAINANREVRAVVLASAGRAFSAGGNLKAMQAREGSFAGNPAEVREAYRGNVHKVVRSLWGIEVPVVAAVQGAAIGLGCDVACMADVRIAAEDAKFGVTFLKVGLIPGDGGAWLLPRIVGYSRAAELLFTGDVIDAQTATAWGLVSRVVANDALLAAAKETAHRMAKQPPHALRLAKSLLRHGQQASYDTIMEMSAAAQGLMHHTADHEEAVSAFFEKREPRFTGS
jgi:enoyl-CoA hydratase/carnithine racemase